MTATNKANGQQTEKAISLDKHLSSPSSDKVVTVAGGSEPQTRLAPTARQQSVTGRAAVPARDIVMMEYLRSSMDMTRNFIESQERVMLAYLSGASSGQSQGMSVLDTMRSMPQFAQSNLQTTVKQIDLKPATQQFNFVSPAPTPVYEVVEDTEFNTEVKAEVRTEVRAELSATPVQNYSASTIVAAVPASTDAEMTPDQLIAALIDIVSQRTGYPPEMLDPSLDLEADLGIDSIKRVEILNSFRRLLPEAKQNALEDGIEKLAGVKSLQGIMDWIKNDLASLGEVAPAQNDASNNHVALASRSA